MKSRQRIGILFTRFAGIVLFLFGQLTPVRAVGLPDLVITGHSVSTPNLYQGQTFSININVKNQGDTVTDGAFYRSVFVDRNPSDPALFSLVTDEESQDSGCLLNLNTNEYDNGDYRVQENFDNGVEPGATDIKTVTISGGLSGGTHQIWLYTDPTCTIDEEVENNNVYGPITIEVTVVYLQSPWAGSVVVDSDQNLVAVGRPHVGSQVMTYDGFSTGALSAYVPMLFKDSFGGSYDSALYVQNVDPDDIANITIKYYDSAGTLSCTVTGETVAPLASKGYWLPSQGCLPAGWVGGVVVTSNQPIVAIGRPHIGAEVMTYNSFSEGSLSSYIPMLFKDAFGGSYDSAFYVQNVDPTNTATITIKYYDSAGALSCTIENETITPFASKGYWVPGQSCLPAGWVGGVVVTSDQPIVTVGRPHIGTQVTTYNGFSSGTISSYVPMLFSGAFGGTYDSAFYVQNVDPTNTAFLTIYYYDSDGDLSCTIHDETLAPFASKGYWVPNEGCLPPGWVGSAVVTSDQPVVAVGRPHVGAEVMTYDGFTNGSTSNFIPMLFKNMWTTYNAAFYLQNLDPVNSASLTLKFYDTAGVLKCTQEDSIPALASQGYWVPSATCIP